MLEGIEAARSDDEPAPEAQNKVAQRGSAG
jgi:hypothetical protein